MWEPLIHSPHSPRCSWYARSWCDIAPDDFRVLVFSSVLTCVVTQPGTVSDAHHLITGPILTLWPYSQWYKSSWQLPNWAGIQIARPVGKGGGNQVYVYTLVGYATTHGNRAANRKLGLKGEGVQNNTGNNKSIREHVSLGLIHWPSFGVNLIGIIFLITYVELVINKQMQTNKQTNK